MRDTVTKEFGVVDGWTWGQVEINGCPAYVTGPHATRAEAELAVEQYLDSRPGRRRDPLRDCGEFPIVRLDADDVTGEQCATCRNAVDSCTCFHLFRGTLEQWMRLGDIPVVCGRVVSRYRVTRNTDNATCLACLASVGAEKPSDETRAVR